jgi:triosephosphate isomerase (TIM)
MKPDNADALLAEHDIDGGLIGGASLEAKSFVDLVQSAAKSLDPLSRSRSTLGQRMD